MDEGAMLPLDQIIDEVLAAPAPVSVTTKGPLPEDPVP
jgi:hypothetical protein